MFKTFKTCYNTSTHQKIDFCKWVSISLLIINEVFTAILRAKLFNENKKVGFVQKLNLELM